MRAKRSKENKGSGASKSISLLKGVSSFSKQGGPDVLRGRKERGEKGGEGGWCAQPLELYWVRKRQSPGAFLERVSFYFKHRWISSEAGRV